MKLKTYCGNCWRIIREKDCPHCRFVQSKRGYVQRSKDLANDLLRWTALDRAKGHHGHIFQKMELNNE